MKKSDISNELEVLVRVEIPQDKGELFKCTMKQVFS